MSALRGLIKRSKDMMQQRNLRQVQKSRPQCDCEGVLLEALGISRTLCRFGQWAETAISHNHPVAKAGYLRASFTFQVMMKEPYDSGAGSDSVRLGTETRNFASYKKLQCSGTGSVRDG